MKTSTPKPLAAKFVLLDASGKVLGRIATKAASILRGKHRASFVPHQFCGDHVIIINAEKMFFHTAKLKRKTYVKHSGYFGHIKTQTLERMFSERPMEVMEKAITGMLPKNRLRPVALKHLHIFAGAEHPFAAQKPVPLSLP